MAEAGQAERKKKKKEINISERSLFKTSQLNVTKGIRTNVPKLLSHIEIVGFKILS